MISLHLVHDNLTPHNVQELVDLNNLNGRKGGSELEGSILNMEIYLSKSTTGQYRLANIIMFVINVILSPGNKHSKMIMKKN